MKKEIRIVNEKKGIVRITTADERWYAKPGRTDDSGLPIFVLFPSVTWIVSVYPKLGLMRLRDELGAEETDLLKKLGGERGSKVHDACSAIIRGEEVRVDSKFVNPSTGFEEELTAEEIAHVQSFVDWIKDVQPEFLAWDENVYSKQHGYGGTLDAVARIGDDIYLIDFKTSKVIGTDYCMQVSAYAHAITSGETDMTGVTNALTVPSDGPDKPEPRPLKLAILQLGQKPLKTIPTAYRWKPVEDCFDLFLATRKIWEDVYRTQIADYRGFSQKDFPLVLSPAMTPTEAVEGPGKGKKTGADGLAYE